MREANMELGDVDKEIKEIRHTIDPRRYPPAASTNPPVKPGTNLQPSEETQSTPGELPPAKPDITDSEKHD
jgi:hypothetical protein